MIDAREAFIYWNANGADLVVHKGPLPQEEQSKFIYSGGAAYAWFNALNRTDNEIEMQLLRDAFVLIVDFKVEPKVVDTEFSKIRQFMGAINVSMPEAA